MYAIKGLSSDTLMEQSMVLVERLSEAATDGWFLGRVALALATGAVLAGTALAEEDGDCLETKNVAAEYSLQGIRDVAVRAGAGSLTVLGKPGLMAAQIRGVACSRRRGDLEKISLDSHSDSATLALSTVLPPVVTSSLGNLNARLHLTVEIPSTLGVRVVDTTGSLKVRDVAWAEIDDETGSIEVQDVPGLVHVVSDTSGSIKIERVGSVRIDEDGSGSIKASVVAGDVYVGRDGAGSISADEVGGSFTVVSNSTGGIRHHNVAGEVRIAGRRGAND
ncbi:MAG: hypothetical protein AAFX85_01220 [Pseudomonadota bacterium]